ncbi:Na(+)-translocating NADH-quinone reductase subunit C [Alcanivorax sp. ALC70]|nr:Na(+)-translocating NADH-quinone reductase subunit C [Alcanivorax sp. ALC70]
MAFLVSAVCTVIVSAAAVLLDPVQQANRAAEQAARMEAMLAAMPDMAALIERTGGDDLETLIVDLRTGGLARDIEPDTLDAERAFSDPVSTTPLEPDQDLAGLGERPDLVPIHVLRENGRLRLVILPVVGQGYQSTLRANLALEGDLRTVAGFSIIEQGETPGWVRASTTRPGRRAGRASEWPARTAECACAWCAAAPATNSRWKASPAPPAPATASTTPFSSGSARTATARCWNGWRRTGCKR